MRALVTGSAGFVGRHFATELKSHGYYVVEVDKVGDLRRDEVSGVSLGGMDVRDWFKVTSGYFDLVIHCAANVGGRRQIDKSPLWVADNLGIDSAFFQWALETKPGRIVYFSSSAAYPIADQERGVERRLREQNLVLDDPWLPDSTYGWSKLTGEKLAQIASKQGLKIHIVRPFSGYGEDQSNEYPFGAFRDRVLAREDPFQIWGDGTQVRHWIHIDDIVEAVMRMVELEIYNPVNLAQGEPLSFNEFAGLWFDAAAWRPTHIEHLLDAPMGVHYRAANTDRLDSFYVPKITLEEGIQRALAHVPIGAR